MVSVKKLLHGKSDSRTPPYQAQRLTAMTSSDEHTEVILKLCSRVVAFTSRVP